MGQKTKRHLPTIDATQPELKSAKPWLWIGPISALVLVIALCWFQIGNLDLGYHLAYGNHFLETGEIVGFEPDPFLYPETGIPFVNLNWGGQVVFALVERIGGVIGLFALRMALVLAVFASIAHIIWHRTHSQVLVAFGMFLAAMAGYERFSLRPELFSYVILSIQLVILDSGVRRRRDVAALVVLQLLLVNLHSYFFLGLALTVAYLVGRLASNLLPPREMGNASAERSRPTMLAIALTIQFAACFVHPFHYRAFLLPIQTLGYLESTGAMGHSGGESSASAWGEISEFQSPFSFWGQDINAVTIYAYLIVLTIAAFLLISMIIRRRWSWAFVVVGFAFVSFKMRRNIAPFAFIVVPIAIASLGELLKRLPNMLRSRGRLAATIGCVVLSVTFAFFALSGRLYYFERRITRHPGVGYSPMTFPIAAVDWLSKHEDINPRLYVDYFTSSNTLIDLPDRFRLFVDTNTFAYEESTLNTAFDLGLAKIQQETFFDKYDINVVLLHAGPDTQLLIGRLIEDRFNWALVYVDPAHVIFLRRAILDHVQTIRENQVEAISAATVNGWIEETTGPSYVRSLMLVTTANVPLALGDFQAAILLLDESIRLTPDYAEAWHRLGVCYLNKGKHAARINLASEAIKQWRKAADCFERAERLRPDDTNNTTLLNATREALRYAEQMMRRN